MQRGAEQGIAEPLVDPGHDATVREQRGGGIAIGIKLRPGAIGRGPASARGGLTLRQQFIADITAIPQKRGVLRRIAFARGDVEGSTGFVFCPKPQRGVEDSVACAEAFDIR